MQSTPRASFLNHEASRGNTLLLILLHPPMWCGHLRCARQAFEPARKHLLESNSTQIENNNIAKWFSRISLLCTLPTFSPMAVDVYEQRETTLGRDIAVHSFWFLSWTATSLHVGMDKCKSQYDLYPFYQKCGLRSMAVLSKSYVSVERGNINLQISRTLMA